MPPVVFLTRFNDQVLVSRDDRQVLQPTPYRDIVGLPVFRQYVRRRVQQRRGVR